MAWRIDPTDENAIVMSGHREGIADSPYEGISDMRNMNIVPIPGEASVNFATSAISQQPSSGSITSASSGADTITITGATFDSGTAITLAGASLPAGTSATRTVTDGATNSNTTVTSATAVFTASDVGASISGVGIPSGTTISGFTNATTITISNAATATATGVTLVIYTTYWAVGSAGVYQLYTDYALSSLVNITGTGTGTWATVDMGQPKYFTSVMSGSNTYYWMLDANGRAWTNTRTTVNTPFYWTYSGNRINSESHGNGIVAYNASGGNVYVFVFSNSSIDYTTANSSASISWSYQWNPATGLSAGYNYNPTQRLKTSLGIQNSHEAIVGPDNKVYYCDANFIGRWYQADPTITFVPATSSTYVYDQTAVLPFTDVANCINATAVNGFNLIIGGQKNVAYLWDAVIAQSNSPILLAEYNVQKMVTVNTNTYIFCGNRGRIYITNGSQAQLFKKLPDHLSGVVEPYYVWGGAMSNKNQLYFSAKVTNNANTALNVMGGMWAIDLDDKAMRLTNQLSYATYAGYATAMIPNFSLTAAGSGFFAGWDSGASTYGIDTTISTPYTGSQAYIDYEMIPVGTYYKPNQFKTVEYKLSVPMVTNESVSIYYRLNFNDSYTLIFTSNGVTSSGSISDNSPVNFDNPQWIQLRVVTNSTASSPSFTRLEEIRLK